MSLAGIVGAVTMVVQNVPDHEAERCYKRAMSLVWNGPGEMTAGEVKEQLAREFPPHVLRRMLEIYVADRTPAQMKERIAAELKHCGSDA